ncbi:MAG: hypothetical protein L6R41_000991 [Letrouitia leprolyta]|nr:MAG: hypothetical protein L6R41_000991 [Letrouitia leprolyta]
MALSIQLGARSLGTLGISVSDVAAILQHGRVFGNWLRASQNDQELFESISEVYGAVMTRRGLVDVTLMNNRWSRQLHLIHQGRIVRDNPESRKTDTGQLGRFSWLMVTLVTALDNCMTSSGIRHLLVNLFVESLERDDVEELIESLEMQLQTNIEGWRSVGCARGMVGPVSRAMRQCRQQLLGESSMPLLHPAEVEELSGFLRWMMNGDSNRYHLVSATLYCLVNAISTTGIQVVAGDVGTDTEGVLAVQYAGQHEPVKELMSILEAESLVVRDEKEWIVPQRISYNAEAPWQMIESFPRPFGVKNDMARWWQRGAFAAEKVTLKPDAFLQLDGVMYHIDSYDECTARHSANVLGLANQCFPVDSEMLLSALAEMLDALPDSLQNWLCQAATLDGGGIHRVDPLLTEKQIDCFLCYQALVLGYWYQLVKPLLTFEYLEADSYLHGLWSYRDSIMLAVFRLASIDLRRGLRSDTPRGIHREPLLRLLSTMYAGDLTRNQHYIGWRPTGKHLLALMNKVSILSMSLLKPFDDASTTTKFAIISLPTTNILSERDGELWSGSGSGIPFQTFTSEIDSIPTPSKAQWSIHAKMALNGGHLDRVVLAARCNGILIGSFSPAEADAVLLRSLANNSSNLEDFRYRFDTQETPYRGNLTFLDIGTTHFLESCAYRPSYCEQVVIIRTNGEAAMRYAAAGFYAYEHHVVLTKANVENAVEDLRKQFGKGSCCFGVIID